MTLHRPTTRRRLLRNGLLAGLSAAAAALQRGVATARDAADPLPSWNPGPAKDAVIDFVRRVTARGEADFVPPGGRIAVFDNDGTLWPENPVPFQLAFVLDELKRLGPEHPKWKENATIQAALSGDLRSILSRGVPALAELLAATHAGMTVEDFEGRVRNWMRTARHPRFGRPYQQLAYRPMLEVLDHLGANRFKTFIVSGGGADFMRVWAEETYGIPPERVIGSYGTLRYEFQDGKPALLKEPKIELVDDKEGKPVAIHRFIGRRPIACFGNSDGDQAMLEWTTVGRSPGLGLIVHHTDAEREYAYDAAPRSTGKLVTALAAASDRGWIVVDMKRDWKTIFLAGS
jgi:phosphoglycolate phosphatase-like HAD superfamily hydrolase